METSTFILAGFLIVELAMILGALFSYLSLRKDSRKSCSDCSETKYIESALASLLGEEFHFYENPDLFVSTSYGYTRRVARRLVNRRVSREIHSSKGCY